MSPLFIANKYGYRDAAFAGFSSPINFMRREVEELWPNDRVSVVINIGVGLTQLVPSQARRDWAPTEPYMKPFVEKLINKLPPSTDVSEQMERKATFITRQFMVLAVDTVISREEQVSTRHVASSINFPLILLILNFILSVAITCPLILPLASLKWT